MRIAIKNIDGFIYIDKNLREDINYTDAPYNFTLIEIDDKYNDCFGVDFDEDLKFNVGKYDARKQKENSQVRIQELKGFLANTDYKAIKYAEGLITEKEYTEIKAQRQEWREEINRLEEEMK